MNIVINLNKPGHISSQQAVLKVKRIFAARKAGHAGTLDPLATGVLTVCLNEATKITRFLADLDKEYVVRLKLGEKTDTYDSTGRITATKDSRSIQDADICDILPAFTGTISQTPPAYSAIKIKGQTSYVLARNGITVEIPARSVTIHFIDFIGFEPPYLDLRVSCSKGTYIRSLCNDIGISLEVGAHMVSLVRTKAGIFRIEDSISIEDLKTAETASRSFYSIDSAISHLPEIILDAEAYQRARNGVPVSLPSETIGGFPYIRLKSPENTLFGIGKVEEMKTKIERLLN
jgi:tRNA pseudouridine55 synthase